MTLQSRGTRAGRRHSRGLWIALLLAAVLPLSAQADSPKYKDRATTSYLGTVDPGKHVAFRVDTTAGTITLVEETDNTLDADSAKAVARAPKWLRTDLRETLRKMAAADRAPYAKVINQATAKTVDEIAFLVAHLSVEDLKVATTDQIKKNAELIYDIAPQLNYAEIVEKGAAGTDDDYHTTIKYKVKKDGKAATFELPRSEYYWWVVHPRLDLEQFVTLDPEKGTFSKPPTGVTWREYFLAKIDAASSPRHHYIMRTPNAIKEADVSTWNKGKALAYGHLGNTPVGTNEVVRAGKSGSGGQPVMIQYGKPGGTCNTTYPMPDGIYLATTLALEQIADGGDVKLLENFVLAGPGRGSLRDYDMVSKSPVTQEKRKILLVRDRLPFNLSADPNEAALKKYNRDYVVLTSAQFATLVDGGKLSSGGAGATACTKSTDCATTEKCIGKVCLTPPLYNLQYNKIVVPSDQPRALYVVLNKYKAAIEKFVAYSGTFQLNGATRAADDWSDLTMPGDIKSIKQDSAAMLTEVHLYGNALLRDVMSGVDLLWDGVRRCSRFAKETCPKGDRKMATGDDAMDRVGWWSGQMLDRSVGEYVCLRAASSPQRSWYPQRIVKHHYGNCGEIQDVVGAASRAALIPSMLTYSVEDHVWNEFYAGDGQWYPYDTGWSDKPMRIGSWGVSGDGDSGGGKENAVMVGWRGDGKPLNLLGRFKDKITQKDGKLDYDYTTYVELTIKVIDANRAPIDGATVTLITENYYWNHGQNPAYGKMAPKSICATTGRDGTVTINVGDKRNHFVNVLTPLGSYPKALNNSQSYVSDINAIKLLLPKASAIAGTKVTKEIQLTGNDAMGTAYGTIKAPPAATKATMPAASGGSDAGAAAKPQRLSLSVQATAELRHEYSSLARRHYLESAAPGKADIYVTDEANYLLFKDGKAFKAWSVQEQAADSGALQMDLPSGLTGAVVIVSNKRLISFGQEVKAAVTLQEQGAGGTTDPTDPGADDEGCSISSGGDANPLPLLGLLALLALLRRRRKLS